jgi:epoxyqueuosine reductase QueG
MKRKGAMDKARFEQDMKEFVQHSPGNYIPKDIALRPDLAGMQIFREPIFGYASAEDPLFEELKNPGIIGPHFMIPREWLSGAETVISLFLPFTETVRAANRQSMDWPAIEWLHARIEGQAFQDQICTFGEELFRNEGIEALAPMVDPRFSRINPLTHNRNETSNWSERHVAYACGLGTFGLSKGLITQKGIAGRYISVITAAHFTRDKRPYTGLYDYCIRCGACVRNCPGGAISLEKGKSHPLCAAFMEATEAKHAPRFGCGKCQVKVPCEERIPIGHR